MIECGIRLQDIKKALDFSFKDITGCLVSHCHKDHSKAATDLIKAGINVYTSKGTAGHLGLSGHRTSIIEGSKQFKIDDFTILPFKTQHDCPGNDPLGFLIQYRPTGEKLLFATDTYYIKYKFKGLNYIMVECNYVGEILYKNIEEGLIPASLKNRLLESHFSLDNVENFLKANNLQDCRKIILIHLSEGNSDADLMRNRITGLTGIETVIAEPGEDIPLNLYPF